MATLARALVICLVGLTLGVAGAGDLNEAGKAAYARGDFVLAERLFAQAVAAEPGRAVLHYHLGVARTRLGQWGEARAALERALGLGPSPAVAAAARETLRELAPLTRPAPRPEEDAVALQESPAGFMVEVVLNGRQRGRFLVDTGASACVVSPALARALALASDPEHGTVRVRTLAGETSGLLVTLASVRVGDTEARGVRAIVHAPPAGMDGILGQSFLARYRATLDPRGRRLSLAPR